MDPSPWYEVECRILLARATLPPERADRGSRAARRSPPARSSRTAGRRRARPGGSSRPEPRSTSPLTPPPKPTGRSRRPSCACCATCRATCRFARSQSACSSRPTRSRPTRAGSTESSESTCRGSRGRPRARCRSRRRRRRRGGAMTEVEGPETTQTEVDARPRSPEGRLRAHSCRVADRPSSRSSRCGPTASF